jgi:hypothetical protein
MDQSVRIRTIAATLSAALMLSATGWAVPVTDGMLLWLDASDPATLFQDAALTIPAAAGDPIGGWADKSGNGYDATQSDGLLQPFLDATAMNGRPAVRFEGASGDGMLIDDSLSLVRPYTAFIVNQYYGATRGRTLQGRDANWLHGLWMGNISSFAGGFIGGNPVADGNFVYVADTTGTPTGDSTLYVNGLNMTVNSAPLDAPGRLGLVSGGMFPLEVSDADIAEVVIYNRVLDSSELTQVRDFLYAKYDTTTLLPPAPTNTVLSGAIGGFTGGDAGEGLDMSGNFAYAINVGGPGGAVVGDATFTDGSIAGMAGGSSPGATINVANEILAWHTPAYGDSPDDNGIESVMQSIRWNVPPGVNVDLNVTPGQAYKLQLLFAENCCDRGFDITVEGELAVDNFNVQVTQGGIANTAQGAVFSKEFVAGDDVLNILLGPSNPLAPDNNAILNGLTLELVPEPGSMTLAVLALLAMASRRQRKASPCGISPSA